MSQLEGALNIGGVKKAFKGRRFRLKLANDLNDAVVDMFQAQSERIGWPGSYRAATDKKTAVAVSIDDAVTGNPGSAIDAQNPHAG